MEKRLGEIAMPASEYLLKHLGRRVTDAEQEEAGEFLADMRWDNNSNRFISGRT